MNGMSLCHFIAICDVFCAGMEVVDFSLYPDREYQLAWLRTFLELRCAESGRPASDVTDVDVERLYVQVNKFSLVRMSFLSLFMPLPPLRHARGIMFSCHLFVHCACVRPSVCARVHPTLSLLSATVPLEEWHCLKYV